MRFDSACTRKVRSFGRVRVHVQVIEGSCVSSLIYKLVWCSGTRLRRISPVNVVVSACPCGVLSVSTARKCPSCALHHGSACPNTTWSQFQVPVSHTRMAFFTHTPPTNIRPQCVWVVLVLHCLCATHCHTGPRALFYSKRGGSMRRLSQLMLVGMYPTLLYRHGEPVPVS